MKNIFIISKYTFREALSRKVFITFFGITTFIVLIFLALFLTVDASKFFGELNLSVKGDAEIAKGIFNSLKLLIINPLFGGGLFLSIFSAAGFIPNMLEKGSIEILLSKPISRAQLITGKFLGVTFMVLLNIAYAVTAFYMMFGFKFNLWESDFLFTIPTITLAFGVLYSLMILIGILTRSSLTAMMLSYVIFFILSPVLYGREAINAFMGSTFWEITGNIFHYLIPRTAELGELTILLAGGGNISDYSVIIHSVAYIILTLLLSIFIFNKKDY